jgi:hypothetical protein
MGLGFSRKYGWSMASMAFIRLRQSKRIRSFMSERPIGDSSRNFAAMLPGYWPNPRIASAPGSSFQPGIVCSFGEPISSKIIWAWLMSLWPARMGLRLNISPKTQPAPHMSIAGVYFLSWRSSSGGLYHRVTTKVVYSRRASPLPIPRCGTASS